MVRGVEGGRRELRGEGGKIWRVKVQHMWASQGLIIEWNTSTKLDVLISFNMGRGKVGGTSGFLDVELNRIVNKHKEVVIRVIIIV